MHGHHLEKRVKVLASATKNQYGTSNMAKVWKDHPCVQQWWGDVEGGDVGGDGDGFLVLLLD